MFSKQDIADYYDQTLTHYRFWWKMDESLAVHYGIWKPATRNFSEALQNTNQIMAEMAGIKPGETVLDAGCGVGGAAFYLASNYNCQVEGISLSERQIALAQSHGKRLGLNHQTRFSIADYLQTPFKNQSFDKIWACESLCYANDYSNFLKEASRLLKPGGRVVLSDYFLTEKGISDPDAYLRKWGDTWAISRFNYAISFQEAVEKNGFKTISRKDFTPQIRKSAKRLFWSYLLGALPAMLYNLTHRPPSFAKTHYLSGKYQYLSLIKGQWRYEIWVLEKVD
jgi:cyclopropane fatty-acyl-phospholipid synthase-like methyltransferase